MPESCSLIARVEIKIHHFWPFIRQFQKHFISELAIPLIGTRRINELQARRRKGFRNATSHRLQTRSQPKLLARG